MKRLSLFIVVMLCAVPAAAELSSTITSPYLKLQVGLAGDSINGVSEHARAIVEAAVALGADADAVVVAAKALAATQDIAAAREAFGSLSDALIHYLELVGLGELKVAYCPMLDKSWVQEEGPIANPFYGAMMLNCGSFR